MTESLNPILKLFQVGITRDDFIKQYKELEAQTGTSLASVFSVNEDITPEDIFDKINSKDDALDENEIAAIAKKYEDDGENVLSEQDILVLYNEIYADKNPQEVASSGLRHIMDENIYVFNNPQDIQKNSQNLHFRYIQHQLDSIDKLIQERIEKRDERIALYESRIDNEILKNNKIEQEFKLEYQTALDEKKEKETELKDKQEKLENETDSEKQETLQQEIDTLNKDIQRISTKIKSMRSSVSNDKIKNLEKKIEKEKQYCEDQVKQYNLIKERISQVQDIAVTNHVSEPVTESSDSPVTETPSQDENITVTYDAQKLTQTWNKGKGLNLSTQFVQKTMDVAKNIGCDANDLLALMYSESGIKSSIQNRIGATGLIQFMPQTAKALGTTTDELKNMSPEKQLDYVQLFFEKNKKMFGMSGKNLSAGDLYALTFLPARAKGDVLTTSGEKYYKCNAGLDANKDGQITKQDLTTRIRKFIPQQAKA